MDLLRGRCLSRDKGFHTDDCVELIELIDGRGLKGLRFILIGESTREERNKLFELKIYFSYVNGWDLIAIHFFSLHLDFQKLYPVE